MNANIKLILVFTLCVQNCMMSMSKKTTSMLKKFTKSGNVSKPYLSDVFLYAGHDSEKYFDALNQGAVHLEVPYGYDQSITPETKYINFIKDSQFDPKINLSKDRLRNLDARIRVAQDLELSLDFDEDDFKQAFDFLLEKQQLFDELQLGSKLKHMKIEKFSDLEHFRLRVKQLKIDTIREIFSWLGIPSTVVSSKDVLMFLNSKTMKTVQDFMNIRVCDVFKMLNYDALDIIVRGIESDSFSVQYMTVRSFFFPVNNMGMPSMFSFCSLALAHAFSQGLCELLVGRPLTLKEFKQERVKYHVLLNSLEKMIAVALWMITVHVSVEFFKMIMRADEHQEQVISIEDRDILLSEFLADLETA